MYPDVKQNLSATKRQEWLKNYVRMKLPYYLAESAEDVLQDVMLKLMKAESASDGMIENFGYMKQTVMSVVIDHIRKYKNNGAQESSLEEVSSVPELVGGQAPDEMAHQSHMLEHIHQAMGQLSQVRQTALKLYLRGMKIKEIAQLTDMNMAKVRNEVYRGKNEVLKILNTRGVYYEVQ